MNGKTLPHLNFFLLCEDVKQDADGVLTFKDILRHIIYTGEPEEPRPYVFYPFVAIGIYHEDESVTLRLRLAVEGPDGREISLTEFPVGFYDGTYKPTQIGSITFAATPGAYWFKLYHGQRLLGQYALIVTYLPEVA